MPWCVYDKSVNQIVCKSRSLVWGSQSLGVGRCPGVRRKRVALYDSLEIWSGGRGVRESRSLPRCVYEKGGLKPDCQQVSKSESLRWCVEGSCVCQ